MKIPVFHNYIEASSARELMFDIIIYFFQNLCNSITEKSDLIFIVNARSLKKIYKFFTNSDDAKTV
jgi:hypothetical protein